MLEDIRAVSQIAGELTSGDEIERLAAVRVLAERGTPDATELLLEALADHRKAVRQAAKQGLAGAGQGILANQILGVLRGEWKTINELTQLQAQQRRTLSRTFERLLSTTGKERRWVIHALGRLGDPRAIPWLTPYLHSSDPLRQRAACISLSLLGADNAIPRLLALVQSHDAQVSHAATVALERLGEKRLMDAYRGVPDGDGEAICETAQLVDEGDRRIIPLLLIGLLRSGHRCRTISTGLTLCAMGVAEAVPHVITLLEEIAVAILDQAADTDGEEVIVTIAGLLGSCSLPEAAAAAVALLAHPLYWTWQAEIAEKLLETLNPAALPAVLGLLREGARWPEPDDAADAAARTAACRLLGKIGYRESIQPLLGLLGEPEAAEDLRNAAVTAIDQICDRDATALPLLPRLILRPQPDREIAAMNQRGEDSSVGNDDGSLPEKEYMFPILQALVDAGGKSGPRDVKAAVYPVIASRLSAEDRRLVPDKGTQRTQWEHRVEWVRFLLRTAEFIRRDSKRGVWEITDEGRAQLTAADLETTWGLVSQAFTEHRRKR
ncbi:MAG: HEAT repeat domain-containing protein [Armatimonadota bacterium]